MINQEEWRCYLKSNGGSYSRGRVLFQKVKEETFMCPRKYILGVKMAVFGPNILIIW